LRCALTNLQVGAASWIHAGVPITQG
jgi:hypothetical protein